MNIARRMVTHWGMSDRLGPVAFRDSEDHPFLGREITEPRRFSEHTAQVIDEEVSRILRTSYERAVEMLTVHRAKLECIAKALEKEETLDDVAIEKLIGPPAWKLADAAAANGKPATDSVQIVT
jgi:cell division protease FtsH